MHRNLSIRSRKGTDDDKSSGRHRFAISSLRSLQQPELSKKLFKLIKSENSAISAHDTAGRERISIASQLSDWGESTEDDAISEISDKLGVLLAEIGEQEDNFAQGLEESRGVLKQIRNTESSVQPSRDHKAKIADELAKLKHKEPTSTKIVTLEQELVRAEAQSLVAEAQLTNTTRQKLKEAYMLQTAVLLERCEKQALLAKQARRIIELLDDTPIQPGDHHREFARYDDTRAILNDAEAELRNWKPTWEAGEAAAGAHTTTAGQQSTVTGGEQYANPIEAPVQHHQEQAFTSAPTSTVGGSTVGETTGPSSTVAHAGSSITETETGALTADDGARAANAAVPSTA